MENENKKSNKTIILVVLGVLVVVAVALVLYFSGIFTKEKESSNSNSNSSMQSNTNSNTNVEEKNTLKPETTTSVTLTVCAEGTATLSIENGKVVLTNTKGVKTTDTSIKGEVIAIVDARTTCSCDIPRDTAVLTKEGDAYLFTGYPEDMEGEPFLKFEKIKSDKKITGLAGLKNKIPSTCSDENLYAFVEDEVRLIQFGNDGTYGNVTIGKTYQELYPYQDWMTVFGLGGTMLEYYSDYRVKMSGSDYLKFEGKELLVKGIYPKEFNEQEQEETYLLVDKDNVLYVITFTEKNESVKYTITKDKKTVKDIIVTPSEFDYNIAIQYTDGSKDELKEVSNYNFIGNKK